MIKKASIQLLSLALVTVSFISCQKEVMQPDNTVLPGVAAKTKSTEKYNTFKGPQVVMGEGHIRSWININHDGVPLEIGIEIPEKALIGLSHDPMDFAHNTYILPLHQKAKEVTAIDHITVDWNPEGHEPETIFTMPHFDFHFYRISVDEEKAIPPYTPETAALIDNLPPMQYWPSGYFPTPGGVPQMGKHWLNEIPAPGTFTKVMIYGSYNGAFIFEEPMVTLDYLTNTTWSSTDYAPQQSYAESGYYPHTYNVYKDEASGNYYVSLSNFEYYHN